MASDFFETQAPSIAALVPVGELLAHREGVKAIAVSGDGQWKATADVGRRVIVWKGDDPVLKYDPIPIWERMGANRRVYSLAFSRDSYVLYIGMTDRLAAYHVDSGVRIWQFRGPRVLAFLPSSPVGLAVNPVTETLAAAYDDGHVGLWTPTGSCRRFWFDNDAPRHLAFTRDGSRLIGSDSFSICIWDAETHAKIARHVPNERVHALALSTGFDVAASRTLYDITIWDVDTGAESAKIPIGRGLPLMAFSPTAKLLAYSEMNVVRVCDFEGNAKGETTIPTEMTLSLGFSADGEILLVGGSDGAIRAYEAPGKPPSQFRI